MNPDEFDKWLDTRPYSKWEAFKDRNTTQVMWMQDAYDAGVAQERERCAKIADGMRMIDKSPIGTLHLIGWNEASKHIAEQIRKGE